MATSGPQKPILLLNLVLLDDGTRNLSTKDISFGGVQYQGRVLNYGNIDKSIPHPHGHLHTSDATVEIADTDGAIRAWFDAYSPIRRIGEIVFEFESDADDSGGLDSPRFTTGGTDLPTSSPTKPLFTGEIVPGGATFSPGKATIKLLDITASWLDRVIPKLLTADNFPNLPYDTQSEFIPIIFGRCNSANSILEPQGVIRCHYVDTVRNLYVVARHSCYSVSTVYRKNKLDAKFFPVNPGEWEQIEELIVINGAAL